MHINFKRRQDPRNPARTIVVPKLHGGRPTKVETPKTVYDRKRDKQQWKDDAHNIRALEPLSDEIRRIAYKMDKKTQDALKTILETPGWQEKAKQWFSQQKQAGKATGLAIPFALALGILSQGIDAKTPEEFVRGIQDTAKVVDTSYQKKIDEMEKIVPYPVNFAEILTLKSGIVGLEKFESTLQGKIEDGMREKVLPAVKNKPEFSVMGKDELTDLITKATMQKINNPKYKDVRQSVEKLLQNNGKKMDHIEKIVNNVVHSQVATLK